MNAQLQPARMLAGRMILGIVFLPAISFGWQAGAASSSKPCLAVGQMAGWDILEHTLSLKGDSGDFFEMRYDDATAFTDGKGALSARTLNLDDRVCVQAFRGGPQSVASRVLVTRRSEIDDRDRQDLMAWERDGFFGAVKSVDPSDHRITLRTPGGSDVLIDAGGPMEFWILPPDALDPANAIAGDWSRLAVGDEIYVRGEKAPGAEAVRARLVISGGFRSLIGSIESMDPLAETIRLRDFRSGGSRSIRFDFNSIYVAGAASGAADRPLYFATIGDLKEGDSVLILARQDAQSGDISALLLITGFSPQEIVRPPEGQSSDWIFKAVGFGGNPAFQPRP